jgi:hypothetical protein
MQFPAIAILASVILFNAPISAPEDQQQRIDAIFASYDRPNSPGCAIGVIQNLADSHEDRSSMPSPSAKDLRR